MQITSRNQQQLQWFGRDELLALSGGNILAFMSLCQHIWDVWLREMRDEPFGDTAAPEIGRSAQTIGAQEASQEWFEKIAKSEHGDVRRQRFIRTLGGILYRRLIGDQAMSNPGHNGFSLREIDLDDSPELAIFLRSLADYGDLACMRHTSKTKGEERKKWYLNPILSPYFNIFHVHTKEPIYLTASQFRDWLEQARIGLVGSIPNKL